MKKIDLSTMLFYVFGSILPIYVLLSHFNIVSDYSGILMTTLFIALLLIPLNQFKFRNSIRFLILICIVSVFIMNSNNLLIAFAYMYNKIVDTYYAATGIYFTKFKIFTSEVKVFNDICLFVSLFQITYSMLLYPIVKRCKYGLIFIITLIFTLPVLIFQIFFDWVSLILLFTYWFMLYIASNFKNTMNKKKIIKPLLIGVMTVCLTGFVFINSFTEAKLHTIYQPITATQDMFDRFNEFLENLSKLQFNSNDINLNNAKNRVFLDAEHVVVTVNRLQDLYIKYYSGAEYDENAWKAFSDEKFESARLTDTNIKESFEYISRYTLSPEDVFDIEITDLRRGDTFSLYPYNLRSSDVAYNNYRDMYVMYNSKNAKFQVWDLNEIGYNAVRKKDYINFVNEYYVKVPDHIQSLFIDMGLPKGKLTLFEARNEILSLLREYTYTLSPGATPEDADFVNYFLIENKKGYCVHFATAATLMFRYYGIPARYVEGYQLSKDQFIQNDNGTWTATALDRDSHAWVEVFDEEYGWQPIEVTVGQEEEKEEPDEPTNPNRPNNNQNQNNNNQTPNTPDNNPILPNVPIGNEEGFDLTVLKEYSYLIGISLFVIVSIIYRKIRLSIRKHKMNQANKKEALFEMVHYVNQLCKYKDVMNDELKSLFEKNKFSNELLNDNELKIVYEYMSTLPIDVYQSLTFIKKIRFKYIDCLI